MATDKLRHPVRGLTCDDFRLFDNGKPQAISFFRSAMNTAPTTVILLDLLNNRFRSRNYSANEIARALEQPGSNGNTYLYFFTLHRTLVPVIALPRRGCQKEPSRRRAVLTCDGSSKQQWLRQVTCGLAAYRS
ncbi:MAG TPA: hypothetical protein VF023_06715 [Bryobacteraceae bacterium]